MGSSAETASDCVGAAAIPDNISTMDADKNNADYGEHVIPTSEYCMHGRLYGDCNPCDYAAHVAFEEYCKSPVPAILIPDPKPQDETHQ